MFDNRCTARGYTSEYIAAWLFYTYYDKAIFYKNDEIISWFNKYKYHGKSVVIFTLQYSYWKKILSVNDKICGYKKNLICTSHC